MKNNYLIKKAPLADLPLDSADWKLAQKGEILNFPWNDNPADCPKTEFYILRDENGIGIRFYSEESNLTMRATHMDDNIFQDSCVEIFCNFNPKNSQKYLNFELSATGFMHIGVGTCRYDRIVLDIDFDYSQFHIATKISENFWEAKFYIPFTFIGEYFDEIGSAWTGNLQKCVEADKTPHFGCWNKITTENPDFHAPADFGDFTVE